MLEILHYLEIGIVTWILLGIFCIGYIGLEKDYENYKEKKNKLEEKDELISWNWPYLRTNSNGAKEYMCPHGVGHGGIHGCDGCCAHPSYKRRKK